MKRIRIWSLGCALLLAFAVLESGGQPAVAGRFRRRCCDAGQAAAPAAKTSPQTGAEPALKPAWEAPAPINLSPAPFVLTSPQQATVDEVLSRWEKRSAMVRTLRCKFTQWEYLPNLRQPLQGKAAADEPRFERNGRLTCAGQQQWMLIVNDVRLPLLYGIKAAQLKQRYYLRLITPKDFKENEVWIDAYPRDKRDAACRLIVRLKKDNLDPYAMRIYDRNESYRTYEFADVEVNAFSDKIHGDLFPRTLCIWRKIVENPTTAQDK
ncbi:MAG: hypothetical protein K8T25_07150 [Planctomycetia bacterium]|nr:hypothetical protein [Planctomycetia bacterium]